MRWITRDDWIETYNKGIQRGWGFIGSKFDPRGQKRTQSAFDQEHFVASNWWNIPLIQQRWNNLITGSSSVAYPEYLLNKYFKDSSYSMLSLGSGNCGKELVFAQSPNLEKVVCVDIAANRLREGEAEAQNLGLKNMEFVVGDVSKLEYPPESFDFVLCNSSLHHFYHIEEFVRSRIQPVLKQGGMLIINEYVGPNRLQFPREQVLKINELLGSIPEAWRRRFRSGQLKRSYSGPGYLRMLLADPSECVESQLILPTLRSNFEVVEEMPYGGNLLMGLFKDIAHHFIEEDNEKRNLLKAFFQEEDEWLKSHQSDYYFGLYRK